MVRQLYAYIALHTKTNSTSWQRVLDIFMYACNNLSAPVFNIVLSFILIKRVSLDFWGEYVTLFLVVNTCVMILGWGNKEFLLREFSRSPSLIKTNWQNSFMYRSVIYCIVAVILFICFDYSLVRFLSVMAWITVFFIYKSTDVLILYKKTFIFSAVIESGGYIILAGLLLLSPQHSLTLDAVVLCSAAIILLKCIITIWYLHADIFPLKKADPFFNRQNTLLLSLPFFLPSLAGMLQAKADLYSVAWFLSKDKVGEYQIFMNLINVPHILAGFVIMPFLKNIYRLRFTSIHKIIRMMTIGGILISLPVMGIIYIMIENYYGFSFSVWMYIIGYIQIIPFFIYLIKIHMLFRSDKQYVVIWISLIAAVFGFVFSILLIPYFGLEGAILVSALTQWFTLGLYSYFNRFLQR